MHNIKPVYTTERIADHLLRDQYWSNYFIRYKPDVLTTHRLSFDITELNPNAQEVARWALGEWSKVVDLTFEETSIHSDIKFISSNNGYVCTPRYDSRYFMEINFDKADVWRYGIGKGTILSHNALHEIGHALGLMHPGSYNGGYPVYGVDNDYENDSFLTSVMSYFMPQDSMMDASFGYCATPMVSDIVAVQKIYGAPKGSLGNNIYKIEVQQKDSPFIQTIYDSGGDDLLDLTLIGGVKNYIDLNTESWSSIGGYEKNMTIAQHTVIESVVGSSGNDVVIGNSANNVFFESSGNDVFDGSSGLDTFFYYAPSYLYKIYRFENAIIVYDANEHKQDFLSDVERLRFADQCIDSVNVKQRSILEYTASYEDLIQVIGQDVFESMKHFYEFGLSEGRDITFDSYLYLGSYDDLRNVFGSDRGAAARHYITHGVKEGRNPDAFKALEYIASHEDLINAFADAPDLVQVGKDHFSNFGCEEGRFVTFDSYLYLGSYDDLRNVFGSDRGAAARHYITHGVKEGRNPDAFKALEYIASHEDLINAFADAPDLVQAGKDHFSNFGYEEGRSITFNPDLYLTSYDDLWNVFGSDRSAAAQHYITHGMKEGRALGISGMQFKSVMNLSEKSRDKADLSLSFDHKKVDLYTDYFGDGNYYDSDLYSMHDINHDFS
ncbi:M10 family metallopeptidase C-terminal domain-containing protein [Candidatus Liberibacter asiaticus]|uniref:Serralysin n=9 Tax=Liberibacter asiaticus TaxID=34021 RepID=C6XHW4_LIBAP|nr:M10 family metallopeptidase C-terminal domain-containing protein [Candidatus Liberibacter asiaticus]ACT56857.1 serralysin [Candidatus Liberibacter asiaticus str. psy62]KAE9512535.1 Serralysin C precursor [Candidatus Liberibacter asiaticus]KAE9520990.1 Serralysin C precursor [Candidatus Liberibacter asiaticus]MCU7488073.1 M10 family metallopeptidase C-terminal domain-containing protein [Candidatus Liberibacter asiaticus]QNS30929.1 serralysin [Candidatus Liberibacter asiaticus]